MASYSWHQNLPATADLLNEVYGHKTNVGMLRPSQPRRTISSWVSSAGTSYQVVAPLGLQYAVSRTAASRDYFYSLQCQQGGTRTSFHTQLLQLNSSLSWIQYIDTSPELMLQGGFKAKVKSSGIPEPREKVTIQYCETVLQGSLGLLYILSVESLSDQTIGLDYSFKDV